MPFEVTRRAPPTLNLSALIDVVFILLIFVVLAANFDRIQSLDVNLPSAQATSPASSEALTLVIPASGAVRLDNVAVAPEELTERLRALRGQHEALLLVADGAVAFERAVAVLGDAAAAGFQNVSIATRAPDGGVK